MNKFNWREYLKFIPLLILYIAITLIFNDNTLKGDEGRYLDFAENLTKGYYAKPGMPVGFLWNGPGYPIILLPFVLFKIPFVFIKLLNSLLLFAGIIFLYKSLLFFIGKKKAYIVSLVCGLTHTDFVQAITFILTEAPSFFLISASLYYFLRFNNNNKRSDLLVTSCLLGYLMLTKVFFSYVLLICLMLSIIMFIIAKFNASYLRFIKLILYAFLLCLPYLIYTYSITGKIFYWADSGGNSLYCMSTPYESEYGDWFPSDIEQFSKLDISSKKTYADTYKPNTLVQNHIKFLDSISHFNGLKQNALLKQRAITNIKSHKLKFLKNIAYNFGRISFGYPFTQYNVLPLGLIRRVLVFAFIYFPLLYVLIIALIKRPGREIIIPIIFLLISVLGILLLSAYGRFIFPLYPLILFLLGAVLVKRINFLNE